MGPLTLLVLGDPSDPYLKMLDAIRGQAAVLTGDSPPAFDESIANADAILHWASPRSVLEAVWQRAPGVRWVHSRAAGLDTVLFPALVESPVPLTNSKGLFSASLGEFVIGAALFFAKDFRRMLRSQAAGVWDRFDVDELRGKTLGIVGYGDIGRAIAERARPFGLKVLALRRTAGAQDALVEKLYAQHEIRVMLAQCDYVAISTPLTPETLGMIGAAELAAMKPDAVLINVGRGPVVDEAALIRALERGSLRGAALDVFDQEPLPPGHPFYKLENVLLSPHCADNTKTWLRDAMEFFLENFERFRKGEPLLNVVDKKRGY